MKKLLCKVVSTAVAVSLVTGLCPISLEAATNNQKSRTLQAVVERQLKKENGNLSYKEGEVVVLTNKGVGGKTINALKKETNAYGAVIEDTISFDTANNASGFQVSLIKSDKHTTEELVEIYGKSKNVKVAQPNYMYQTSTAGYNEFLWAVDNQGQNAGTVGMDINSDSEKVKMAEGEEKNEKVIAVIDTGMDYENPALKDFVWTNPYPAYLKGEHGYDFVSYDADPMDDNGHGTHCSGIIQSVMNGENIKIMPLKFLDEAGYGDTFGAVGAYNYIHTAQKLGVNVVAINNSWGGGADEDGLLETMINLVGEKGAISVCAAGNESGNLDEYETFPASIESPYVVSVAAANEKGELASFSNYGEKTVDIAAPGADILSYVSYVNFNPTVYGTDEKGKKELCSTYEDFNGTLVTPDVPEKMEFSNVTEDNICYALDTDFETEGQSVALIENDYFGVKKDGEKALEWTIKNAVAGETYIMYLPFTQEKSDTPVYANVMLKASAPKLEEDTDELADISMLIVGEADIPESKLISDVTLTEYGMMFLTGEANCWDQFSLMRAKKVRKTEEKALFIAIIAGSDGDYSVKLDDFAISESNVEEEAFGKTAFYNGTSMATPYATGAVAALANAYPKDSTLDRVGRLKGSVVKTEGLKDKVISDGMLDLASVDKPLPSFDKISMNDAGQLEITGNFFADDVQVKINNEVVKILQQNEKSIIVEGDFYNKTLPISVECNGITYEEQLYFGQGNSPERISKFDPIMDGAQLITVGETAYCIGSAGEVYMFSDYSFANPDYAEIVPFCMGSDFTHIFDTKDAWGHIAEGVACVREDLYAVAVMESSISREAALVKFSWETMMWEKVADLPDAYKNMDELNSFYAYTMSTLTSYNNKLYLLGGLNENSKEVVKDVYSYDFETGNWNKEASMPEGRFASKAVQTGDKLVVTLGGDGTENCPVNLIYDGKSWTKSNATLSLTETNKVSHYITEDEQFTYYTGEVSFVKDGLIYVDAQADKLGDVFTYQLKEDRYEPIGYSVEGLGNRKIGIVPLGSKLYILTGIDIDAELSETPGDEFNTLIYTMDIQSGKYDVYESEYANGGFIFGVGSYLPGTEVVLTAEPWENYYLKSFTVDGQKIPVYEGIASTVISNILANVEVKAEFGAYVSELVLNTDKMELLPGKKQKLNVTVLPAEAENKSLTFKSSNTKVATVDSQGNITANKKAAGKSAVITVYAKDRNTVVATCTVNVKKIVKVKKIKLSTKNNVKKIKAGKSIVINAKVTPTKADNAKLTWSTSNKKYATVKNGKVTAKKAGIGKTVTITAKAKDGSNVKASIKLKIVK